jgi:hypothetical protein
MLICTALHNSAPALHADQHAEPVQTAQKTGLRAPLVCIQVGSAEKFADFNAYYFFMRVWYTTPTTTKKKLTVEKFSSEFLTAANTSDHDVASSWPRSDRGSRTCPVFRGLFRDDSGTPTADSGERLAKKMFETVKEQGAREISFPWQVPIKLTLGKKTRTSTE